MSASSGRPLDPRQRRVPDPVHADLLRPYPGQVPAEAFQQVVIAAVGDAAAGAVAQQLPVRWRVAFSGVPEQGGHEGGRNWLPPDGLAFLAQQDQALLGIEILRAHRDGEHVMTRLPLLSTYLGHAYVSDTEVYLRITTALLQEANTRFHAFAEALLPAAGHVPLGVGRSCRCRSAPFNLGGTPGAMPP